MKLSADIIIVGSGIGGATMAKELAGSGRKILVVEKGHTYSPEQIGSEFHAYNFYDKHGLWSKTKEGVFYYRTFMTGGTSVVSCGNGVRSLEKEFKKIGIDLKKEFCQTEKELGIGPVPMRFIGKGSRAIMKAALDCGFKMSPMPKLINFKKCVSCGNCVLGCRSGAKWTSLEYLKQAQRNKDVSLITGIDVKRILISKGRAYGIQGLNQTGKKIKIIAKTIILSAGGIGTPIILQNSDVVAGQKLFLDLFTVTLGITKDKGLTKEVTMAAVHHNQGFILSPFIDSPSVLVSVVPVPLRQNIRIISHIDHMLGIMVKINDDSDGRVLKNGVIKKTVTQNDLFKLEKGANISKKILLNAGAEPKTIITSRIRGAHPGGTAAIGEVVNRNLETKVKGLFVCDASVLPISPGLPPIVTIVALSKRLAKRIISI
jgi:choline dehydrogenase-like flavoprotein